MTSTEAKIDVRIAAKKYVELSSERDLVIHHVPKMTDSRIAVVIKTI
jgi:hypothetical protein